LGVKQRIVDIADSTVKPVQPRAKAWWLLTRERRASASMNPIRSQWMRGSDRPIGRPRLEIRQNRHVASADGKRSPKLTRAALGQQVARTRLAASSPRDQGSVERAFEGPATASCCWAPARRTNTGIDTGVDRRLAQQPPGYDPLPQGMLPPASSRARRHGRVRSAGHRTNTRSTVPKLADIQSAAPASTRPGPTRSSPLGGVLRTSRSSSPEKVQPNDTTRFSYGSGSRGRRTTLRFA